MPDTTEPLSDEQTHANAVQFLLDGGQNDAASVLLACEMHLEVVEEDRWNGSSQAVALMSGPREAYEILDDARHPLRAQIIDALTAVLPWDFKVRGLAIRVSRTPVPPDWRKTLLEAARGGNVNNQGVTEKSPTIITWNGLRFRSESERRIAAALDREGVLYLPDCRAVSACPKAA